MDRTPRPADDRFLLAEALFGPDSADQPDSPAVLGKLWGRVGTGRGTTFEVRVGWIAGVEYLQFVETATGTSDKMASILVRAETVNQLAATLADLARYQRA